MFVKNGTLQDRRGGESPEKHGEKQQKEMVEVD